MPGTTERPVEWWVEQTTRAWLHPMPDQPQFELRIQERLAREWPSLAACLEGLANAHNLAVEAAVEAAVANPPKRRWFK